MYFYILNFKQNENEQNELLEMCNHARIHLRNGKRFHVKTHHTQ